MTRYGPVPTYETEDTLDPQQSFNHLNQPNFEHDDPFQRQPKTTSSSSYPSLPLSSSSSLFPFSFSFTPNNNSFLSTITNTLRTRATSALSFSTSSLRNNLNSHQQRSTNHNNQIITESSHPLMHFNNLDGSSTTVSNLEGHSLLTSPSGNNNNSNNNSNNIRKNRTCCNAKAITKTPQRIIRLRWIWIVVLLLGEHGSYWFMVHRCAWPESSSWKANTNEEQPSSDQYYRMAIVADPQLTDWMSYHQSGLVLALVEMYTDIYMKRSFSRLHASLRPDAVLFLGDLNDGGRISNNDTFEKNKARFFEWVFSTRSHGWNQEPIVTDALEGEGDDDDILVYNSNNIRKRQELTKEEKAENVDIIGYYRQRFEAPLDAVERQSIREAGKSLRLYVAGNHDVGFGNTLIRSSMARYKRVFGSVNYEVKVGNHSLVVLDTLALSSNISSIRHESQQFLDHIKQESPTLPRILFTHVPLYRPDATYCGKERETKQLILDRKGEQYQNMVNKTLSREILEGIQPDMVFSGDDHDWCEVAHPTTEDNFTPEVTLRTFSFAQGIHQPSFVMMSLFNPDLRNKNVHPVVPTAQGLPVASNDTSVAGSVERPSGDTTFVYDECMLPNQMVIYIGYGVLFAVSLCWIMVQQYRRTMVSRQRGRSVSILGRWHRSVQPDTTTTVAWEQDDLSYDDPSGPLLLSTANMSNKERKQLLRECPLLSGLFWRKTGRDLWSIVLYVVPVYVFLFVLSII